MLRIGLTGSIGSGKSTVARIFEVLGVPVFEADKIAKKIMSENPAVRAKISDLFGSESYIDGKLNTRFLSQQAFGRPEKVEQLNAIVHPLTIAEGKNWMQSQNAAYALKEAALIFESGTDKDLDIIIGVESPLELRIARTINRSGLTRGEIESRMKFQMPEAEKMRLCDYVIINDEKHMLIPQVLELHNTFVAEAQKPDFAPADYS